MSHESAMNQDVCSLDMAKGLHKDPLFLNYSQKFVKADNPGPGPNNREAMKCNPNEAMRMALGK